MAITPITVYPQSTDSADVFASNGDAFIKQLATQFVPEANTLEENVNAKELSATDQAVIATTQAGVATTQAELATTNGAAQVALAAEQVDMATEQANLALSSSQSALLAPGTSATSLTNNTIGTGLKSFAIEQGKLFVLGMTLKAYSGGSWMIGHVTSHDSITGDLEISSSNVFGSGTFSDWTISISAPIPDLPGGMSVFTFNNFI